MKKPSPSSCEYMDENKLQVGDQLPTEPTLASQAGVSLVTVHGVRCRNSPPRA